MTEVAASLQEAFHRHQAGDLPQAERLYREILRVDPAHQEALHLLGVLAQQTGHAEAAVELINRALQNGPAPRAAMHANLGAAHQSLGQFDAAIAQYQRALDREPGNIDARHNWATALAGQGKHAEAIEIYQQLLAAHPQHRAARLNLGKSLQCEGRTAEAAECYRHLLSQNEADAEALLQLGAVLCLQRRHNEATACFEKLLTIIPDHPQAHFNIGRLAQDQERYETAIAHYRRAVESRPDFADAWNNLGVALKATKQYGDAAACFERVIELTPHSATAHFNLGNALHAQDNHQAAVNSYRRGLEIDPRHLESYLNLGTTLTAVRQYSAAETEYRHALRIHSRSVEAHINLASALQLQGKLDEAASVYDQGLIIDPSCASLQSNALMLPLYQPQVTPEEIYERHQRWGAQFSGAALRQVMFPQTRDPERPLRIGYLSPDFRGHPVGYFMETILRRHDRSQFSISCYAEQTEDDDVTARMRPFIDNWRRTVRLSDADVVRMIQQDRIDILIDLAGHTSGNRLRVMANRPAPLQMTYLGYGTTTGLSTIDYRLTDAIADPPQEPNLHSEELLRLPAGILCYSPPATAPEPSPLPAARNGFVTFGSFNNLTKINSPVLDLWAEILRSLPDSRLFLKNKSFADQNLRRRYFDEMANRGVAAERIELRGPTETIDEHLTLYNQIDIGLDPFPYNGATTTCESLWMGTPVVTLRGAAFVGRMSASLLTRVGLPQFIAATAEDYRRIAQNWAQDLPRLSELRQGLRKQVSASPLCDEAGYVRDLEAAYRAAWRRYCTTMD